MFSHPATLIFIIISSIVAFFGGPNLLDLADDVERIHTKGEQNDQTQEDVPQTFPETFPEDGLKNPPPEH